MHLTSGTIVKVAPPPIFQVLDQEQKLSYIDVNMVNICLCFSAQHACRIQRNYYYYYYYYYSTTGDHGSTVVNVLCYKSEGRWFDPS